MKKILLPFIAIAVLASCNNDKKEKEAPAGPVAVKPVVDTTLVTDSSWGLITATTDFAGLQTIYGTANVKDQRICGPECIDSLDVTIIYPESSKEIIVHWKDSAYHKLPGMLQSYQQGSPYHTASGLKQGSTMKDLLNQNGQKISFAGFGWDYGGYIHSYNKGKLDALKVSFRLDLSENVDDGLFGDVELDTDMPHVKKALDKIVVYEISLGFYKE